MSFFNETHIPTSGNPLTAGQEFNRWGQQQFANNFSKGGITSFMFAPKGRRAGGLFGGGTRQGSAEHHRRLLDMEQAGIDTTKAQKGLEKTAKKKWGELGKLGKVGRVGGSLMKTGPMAAIMGGVTAATTEGSAVDKAAAGVAMGLGSTVGWEVGSKAGAWAGAATGAAIGTALLPGIGTAIGGLIGGVAGYVGGGLLGAYGGEEIVNAGKNWMDKSVSYGQRQKYASGWKGDTSAYNTQKASTMRQMSMQAMNQGMMSSRSGLGHEGVMVHS